jgi:Family of unknown function (DUF5318)
LRISSVDYRLTRRAVLRDFRCGRISRYDVCDAHPEIGRIASNIGELTRRDCPVCSHEKLRRVNFVYGRELAENNGRAYPLEQIFNGFKDRYHDFTCYVVEVCVYCQWNHLLESIHVSNRSKEES